MLPTEHTCIFIMTRAGFKTLFRPFKINKLDRPKGGFEIACREANLDLLARTHLGRLACAQGSQPYVVPFYFAYNNNSLYSFTTVGQKIDWMRANPLVCVEADEVVSPEEWV